ncbi:MAG: hypothetical protein JRI70_08520 [Deltaproteobacteria bacterium]|nr:hypothetical protein [Deltaproteobacteria bacterium]
MNLLNPDNLQRVKDTMDFTAKANDSTALNDAKFLTAVGSNVMLDNEKMMLVQAIGAGGVVGNTVDLLGNAIPKLYTLSPGVRAEVQIINVDVPGVPPVNVTDISIKTWHERGSDSPVPMFPKKTYLVWVDTMGTGWQFDNF